MRAIIEIDESVCDGCGLCVTACAEGAIAIVDGKARLVSETYCDGLGACLGHCPRDAIAIHHREAAPFDQTAVDAHLQRLGRASEPAHHPPHGPECQCPGSAARALPAAQPRPETTGARPASALAHWPVQIRLVNPRAPFLRDADLLVCADCVPFAMPDFHQRWLAGRVVVVGCPKLDEPEQQAAKLAAIIALGGVRSVTVLRMEVPCCGGLARAAEDAVREYAPHVPCRTVVVGLDGKECA